MHSDHDDKELTKAIRVLFKAADQKALSQEAIQACDHIGVKPESLILRQADSFKITPQEPQELGQVRF